MRTLSLLLILANALFWVWSQLIDVHLHPLELPATSQVEPPPRIVLAREVATPQPTQRSAEPEPPVESTSAAPAAAGAVARDSARAACTSVGPFASLPEASHAQAALQAAGFATKQRLEQGELWVGYWVSVQNLPTRAAAEEALQKLADSGITDVYLMPGTDPANVLSLGVFSDFQRAQRRMEEAKARGLDAQIDDRKRSGSVYWIDADLAQPGQTIDMSMFQTDPRKITRLELRDCPQGG